MNKKSLAQVLIGLLALGVGANACLLWKLQAIPTTAQSVDEQSVPSRTSRDDLQRQGAILPNFSALVAQNGPTVVNITAKSLAKAPAGPQNAPYPGSPYPSPPSGPLTRLPDQSLGSGLIISEDGAIITNAHVVAEASEVTVKLTDKREFKAKLIGVDRATDTAVLKIEAINLPSAHFGDPSQAAVGDWVLAIGSPYGFVNSATVGIISGKSRTLPDEGYVPFIQTDVAVNPGSSGGPLFNAKGEVIGINAQIYTQSGGYQGLSFAIPIDVALKVGRQLLSNGRVSRGRLGVGVQELTQPLADAFGLAKPFGVLVVSTADDGSAAKSGIRSGDIILKLDNVDILDPSQMGPLVSDLKPGSQATLTLWRNGESKLIRMTVNEAQDGQRQALAEAGASESRLGLVTRAIASMENGAANGAGGLMVEQASGPSAQAGIVPGDVVLAINGHPVSNSDQLHEQVAKARKQVALLVQRRDGMVFVAVDPG